MSEIPDMPPRPYKGIDQDGNAYYGESDIRVVPRGAPLPELEPPTSRAAERRAAILDDAEAELRRARDLIVTALEDLALLATPQHPQLPTLLGQQLEQVIELRRLG